MGRFTLLPSVGGHPRLSFHLSPLPPPASTSLLNLTLFLSLRSAFLSPSVVPSFCRPPSPTLDPAILPTASTAAQGAYMWSLELLIAAALCATRDALYPPAPAVRALSPPPQHGMEMLGELAELEIQQRSRESREKDGEGEFI